MRRLLYILSEALVLWLLVMMLGGFFVWLWRGFDELGQLILLGYAAVSFFASFKLVLVGGGERSIWTGFYRPVRILALVLPGIDAFRRESTLAGFGQRRTFTLDFRGGRDVSAYDVIDALSDRLHRQHIRHNKSGGILVEDNGATWWVEPELGANRLSGWVESEDGQIREQIVAGLRAFLERDMRLSIA